MPLHQWKYLTWNHFLSLDSHTLFFPLFITYFDIQVHLTIFYTYFYYTQITVPLSNKTSQGPILPSPNYMTHTKTSISIIPRYPNILVLAYPIHHLYHSIPLTPIPMTPNFNQMHSFYTSSYWHSTLAQSQQALPLHCHLRRLAASFAPPGGASVLELPRSLLHPMLSHFFHL